MTSVYMGVCEKMGVCFCISMCVLDFASVRDCVCLFVCVRH